MMQKLCKITKITSECNKSVDCITTVSPQIVYACMNICVCLYACVCMFVFLCNMYI